MAKLSGGLLGALLVAGCIRPGSLPPPEVAVPPIPAFRAPAIPLAVQSPYLNVWLLGDRLTDDSPKLWNGYVKGMAGLLRIDGNPYRFLGLPGSPIPAMRQDAVRVFPTRTEIDFSQDDLQLKLEFASPLDPRDLKLLSLPVVLVRVEISSSKPRKVQLHLDVTGEWAVGASEQRIAWDGRFRVRPSQPRLYRETHHYPDWGEFHWTAVDSPSTAHAGEQGNVRHAFLNSLTLTPDPRMPRPASEDWPAFAYSWDLGTLRAPVVRRALLSHARADAAVFYGSPCRAYWTRHYRSAAEMVSDAAASFDRLRARAKEVDFEVIRRARAAGGDALTTLAALAFRQAFASSELVLRGGDVYALSKDVATGGLVQAVDAIASAAPALLAFNPALLRAQLEPVLEAVRSGWWHDRFAPHSLGSYPAATGQGPAGDLRAEPTATLILLSAALAPHDPGFWADAQPVLRRWAEYLLEAGFPPAPQASSEDVAGPVPGNAHLALRTILALATFPDLRPHAAERMKRWLAETDSKDHTSSAMGDPAGWSLKPSVFFDRLLGLGMVPEEIVARDLRFARSKALKFGIPSDGRKPTARTDALLWTAAIAPPADRAAILNDLVRFYSESPDRVPAADRFEADTGRAPGPRARGVLGAAFAPILLHERALPGK